MTVCWLYYTKQSSNIALGVDVTQIIIAPLLSSNGKHVLILLQL